MKFLDFAKTIGNLKRIKRRGWIDYGEIEDPESVADHVYRLSVLALVTADTLGVDRNKLVEMALVHDLAESIVGDIISEVGTEELSDVKKEKFDKEEAAIKELFSKMDDGNHYISLWEEYENQDTKEAKVLRQLDKFEMVLQALEYQEDTDPKKLEIFWKNARKSISHPVVKQWLAEMEKERM